MKDILVRALKTFIQGFLGALIVTLPKSDISQTEVIKSLLIGAVAGGISALMNFILTYIQTKEELEKIDNEKTNKKN